MLRGSWTTCCRWIRRHAGTRRWRRPQRRFEQRISCLELLERRECLSGSALFGSAIPLELQGVQPLSGIVSETPMDYRLRVVEHGRLTLATSADTTQVRLTLLSASGALLMQSDIASITSSSKVLDVHLDGVSEGLDYFLRIERLGDRDAPYNFEANFIPTTTPFQPIPVGAEPWSSTTADLNGDGLADLIVPNFSSGNATIALGQGDGTFAHPTFVAIGSGANDIAVADFNGDGRLDLATANMNDSSISVLLGRGDGTFEPQTAFWAGNSAAGLAVGDFNGDGTIDVAVAAYGADALTVLLNDGAGAFAEPRTFAVGTNPYAVATADFDGDGQLDLVTANYESNDVSFLRGDGAGGFRLTTTISVGAQPYSLAVGDWNHDGHFDLAVGNFTSNDVTILIGHGDGEFETQAALAAGTGTTAIEAADFNADGWLDLVTANLSDSTASLFLGRPGGTFASLSPLSAGAIPASVTAADFNQDGWIDLAVTDLATNTIQVLLNRGHASFQTEPPRSSETQLYQIAAADFDDDGRLDLATVNYSSSDVLVLRGLQDGTFRVVGRFSAGSDATAIATGDVNGDGALDILTSNYSTADVSVLLGVGDGTFEEPQFFHAGLIPIALLLADFNQDNLLDVATVNTGTNTVSILLGQGNGEFQPPVEYPVTAGATQIVSADLNQDGWLDLAVASQTGDRLSLLWNVGDGVFAASSELFSGSSPRSVAVGDFNGDDRADLVVANADSNSVAVFLGIGAGEFTDPLELSTDAPPTTLVVGDFNRDQRPDVAAMHQDTGSVSIWSGRGDGTFDTATSVTLGRRANHAVVGDFNGDGADDLATVNDSSDVSVLLNGPAGSFQSPIDTAVAGGPAAIAAADFNSDGQLDVVTVNPTTRAVTVALGIGDGYSVRSRDIVLDGSPVAVTSGDFNRDGRPDVAAADALTNSVSILLGLGDGTLQPFGTWLVGERPSALATGDINRDGYDDLVSSDFGSDSVSVLLGRGDGAFRAAQQIPVEDGPAALTLSDWNNDGRLDVIVANSLSRSLTLLAGLGDGRFRVVTHLPLKHAPAAVATGDFNHDGRLDISVAQPAAHSVAVWLARPNGWSAQAEEYVVGSTPMALAAADFNRDGRLDLAVANNNAGTVSVRFGRGDGTFEGLTSFEVGRSPTALVAADFNGDHRIDVASANGLGVPVSVGLGLGDGSFIAPGQGSLRLRSRPLVADMNYDGLTDVIVLRHDGRLLFRAGMGNGVFRSPVVINPGATEVAREVALRMADGQAYLIALNATADAAAFYTFVGDRFVLVAQPAVPGILPTHVVVGDVDRDQHQDVVVSSPASGKVFVYLQRPNDDIASLTPTYEVSVGRGLSDVTLGDLNGDGLPEILMTDQVAGDIRVLWNSATAPFTAQGRFRAGRGLTTISWVGGESQVESRDAPTALVAGQFNGDKFIDVAVLNRGSNQLALLIGDGHGGVLNPNADQVWATGVDPVALVMADFNGDDRADLAVLNQGSADISVFLQQAAGNFREQTTIGSDGALRVQAGNSPSGLSVGDIDGDGVPDLLVGNEFGDVLTLLGNGDGTFRPYQRLDRRVGLAIVGLDSDEGPEFAVIDQSFDRIIYRSNKAGITFQRERADGLLAPSAVTFADLNADGTADLIVSNGGSNEVFVYLGMNGDQFDLGHRFFVGTNPEDLTVSDLNGDGLLDLIVANQGSNDVSLLFGQGRGGDWTLRAGPRLRAGLGPQATAVADFNGDGRMDILVANQESNDVYVLRGLGRGFFNDRQPVIFDTGDRPLELFVGHFDNRRRSDVVTVNAGSNDLTVISASGRTRTVELCHVDVVSAVANDFNADGLLDLVLATRSGDFPLWLGGSSTVVKLDIQNLSDLTNLSKLALGRVTGNLIELYFTREGQDLPQSVTLTLGTNGVPTTIPVALFDGSGQALEFGRSAWSLTPNSWLGGMTTVASPGFGTDEPSEVVPVRLSASTWMSPSPTTVAGLMRDLGTDQVAEYSAVAGSPLEVVATLIFGQSNGFRAEDAGSRATRTAESSTRTVADMSTPLERWLTSVETSSISRHLHGRDDVSVPAAEIPFESPLLLFDLTVIHRAARLAASRDKRLRPQADPDDYATVPNGSAQTHPLTSREPLQTSQRPPGRFGADGDLVRARLLETSVRSISLSALVLGAAAVPLVQDRVVRTCLSRTRTSKSTRLRSMP